MESERKKLNEKSRMVKEERMAKSESEKLTAKANCESKLRTANCELRTRLSNYTADYLPTCSDEHLLERLAVLPSALATRLDLIDTHSVIADNKAMLKVHLAL